MALGFETASTRMEPLLLVSFQVPEEEAEAVMARLVQALVLEIGHFDRCSFQSAAGYERYRPRERKRTRENGRAWSRSHPNWPATGTNWRGRST
jgi:hypothetical protein